MKVVGGTFLLAAALLAGCGGLQPPSTAPGMQQTTGKVSEHNLSCRDHRVGYVGCLVVAASGAGGPDAAGWSPQQLQSAYNLEAASKKRGTGQTVAVIEAYDNPNVASDLSAYRSAYDLPAGSFTKYNEEGQTSNYPEGSPGWGVEIDLDVEMVAASCPNCTIYLVEANSSSIADIEAATAEAVTLGAHIVSAIGSGQGFDKKYFDTPGVEYLASPGDAVGLTEPADFDRVVAVDGTMLQQVNSGKRKWSESLTADTNDGGCFSAITKPAWQHDSYCSYRLANDAAADSYDLAVYDSYDENGWVSVTGEQAAPFLAGVFGLAGNATKQRGGRTFWQPAHQKHLYPISEGSQSCAYSSGNYNTCAGWGSPNGIGAF